jgi:hypothetical protein
MAIAKKKKRFWDVEIPLIRKVTQLIAFDKKDLNGRTIKYDLTRILRGKSVMLSTKVIATEDSLTSIPVKFEIMPYYMKRIVRKGT